ncbi:uncharacterized [Tachysurus ichikawai]
MRAWACQQADWSTGHMGVPLLDTGTWLATDPRPGLEKTERENHSREGGVLDWDEKERRSKGSVEARVDWQTAGHRTRQAVWGRCLHVSEKGISPLTLPLFPSFASSLTQTYRSMLKKKWGGVRFE